MTSDLFSSVFIGQASQSEIPGNYGNDVKIIIELNILHASCIEYITIFDITLNSTHCTQTHGIVRAVAWSGVYNRDVHGYPDFRNPDISG